MGLEKKNLLFNLISQQPDIDKIYLYDIEPYEAKNQVLINNFYLILRGYGWYL